ncbi:alpha/beta hydrolase [Rhodococcus wratislaviensis]|uniref:alpha/beta hydrolase n=1 Tax=Rhodococcus wratislaviensis TaxID=44752 RepID=UPI003658EB5C
MGLSIASMLNLLDDDARSLAETLLRDVPSPPYSAYGIGTMRSVFDTVADAPRSAAPLHSVSDLAINGAGGPIPARCYRATAATGSSAIMYFHGGGFAMGTLDGVDELCRTISLATGFVVLSIDYRLAPEHLFPAGADDCLAAYDWLVRNADSLGVDGRSVALAGDSAGGNLALSVCHSLAQADRPMPGCLVLAYPGITDTSFSRPSWEAFELAPVLCAADAHWFWSQYIDDEQSSDPRAVPMLSPYLDRLPPTLVLSAEIDPLRSDYEHFAQLLQDEGVDVDLKRYDGVLHGFFTEVSTIGKARVAANDTAGFIARHLGQSSENA